MVLDFHPEVLAMSPEVGHFFGKGDVRLLTEASASARAPLLLMKRFPSSME